MMQNETVFTPLMAGIMVVVAFAIGFGAGTYLNGQADAVEAGNTYNGFTQSDRNFLITVANSEADLIAARTAAIVDWCVASGGQWNIIQQNGQVAVNQQTAEQLTQAGADVVQDANGNYIANIAIISRDTCIFRIAKDG